MTVEEQLENKLVEAEWRLEGAKETVSQLSGELDAASQRCGAAEKRIEELATELGRVENEAKRVYGAEIDKLEEQLTAAQAEVKRLREALEKIFDEGFPGACQIARAALGREE